MTRFYREADKHTRPALYCPICQQPVDQSWIYVGTSWDPDQWISGRWLCDTPSCLDSLAGRST